MVRSLTKDGDDLVVVPAVLDFHHLRRRHGRHTTNPADVGDSQRSQGGTTVNDHAMMMTTTTMMIRSLRWYAMAGRERMSTKRVSARNSTDPSCHRWRSAFDLAAARMWNSLPPDVTTSTSLPARLHTMAEDVTVSSSIVTSDCLMT